MVSYFHEGLGAAYFFPNDDVNASEKDGNWHMAMLRAIFCEHNLGRASLKQSDILRYNELRQYMIGRQSTNKYKDAILGEEVQVGANMVRKAYSAIDYDHLITPIPKYINKVVGMIMENGFDISVNATDERTMFSKSKIKTKMAVKMKVPEFFELKKKLGLEDEDEKENALEPKTQSELEIIEQMGYIKLPYEVAFEKKIIPHTLEVSNSKVIEERSLRDLLSLNKICSWDKLDKKRKIYVEEYLDPEHLIIQDMGDGDYSKASYGGFVDIMTIADLRNELKEEGIDITEKELLSVAGKFSGKFTNPGGDFNIYTGYDNDTTTWKYDSFMVPVFYGAKKCMDSYYKTKKTSVEIKGNVKLQELSSGKIKQRDGKYFKDFENKDRIDQKAVVRHGKWVIGTDICFGFGIMENSFDGCKLPFHCYRLPGKSMVELMIPTADMIAVNALRLQGDSAIAAPNGLAIELGALEDLMIGGKKYDPFEAIAIRSQTGNQFWRQRSLTGQGYNQTPPITPTAGGMGQILDERLKIFAHCYQEFAQISGLMDQPSPSQTAAGVTASVSMTNDVLKPIVFASIQVRKQALTSICNKVQMMIAVTEKKNTGYDGVLSDMDYKAIKDAGKLPMASYSMAIIEKPDNAFKNIVLTEITGALRGGKNGRPLIRVSDYLFLAEQLNSGFGIKYIRQFIMLKEVQRDQEDQQYAQQNAQQQNQNVLQQIQTKQQGEQVMQKDKFDLDLRNKLEALAAEHDTTLQQMAAQFGFQDAGTIMQQQMGGGQQGGGQMQGQPQQPQQQQDPLGIRGM